MSKNIIMVNGYWKDDKSKFENYFIASNKSWKEKYSLDDEVFYYGLNESDIIKLIELGEDSDYDFVITKIIN